jgi:type III secretory pathway component EscT
MDLGEILFGVVVGAVLATSYFAVQALTIRADPSPGRNTHDVQNLAEVDRQPKPRVRT